MAVRVEDPPLSDLGRQQAGESGATFNPGDIDMILCSPFLRCIQTADPIAAMCAVPICVEHGLWEVIWGDRGDWMACVEERRMYFPRVHPTYQSLHEPSMTEQFPQDLLSRCHSTIQLLLEANPGKNLCLVTHGAGVVAIVAALLGRRIQNVEPASPCGLYKLEEDCDGHWHPLCQNSTAHMSKLGETRAWPLKEKHLQYDIWAQQMLDAGAHPPWSWTEPSA